MKSSENGRIVYRIHTPSRMVSSFDSMDTLDMKFDEIADSVYLYKTKEIDGTDWDENFQIDLRKKKASYTLGKFNYKTHFIDRKVINFSYPQEKVYFVYRILIYDLIDSEGLIFWTEDFGIIMVKSLYWKTFKTYEYINDEEKNNIIRSICYFTMSDEQFYNLNDWEEKYRLNK